MIQGLDFQFVFFEPYVNKTLYFLMPTFRSFDAYVKDHKHFAFFLWTV